MYQRGATVTAKVCGKHYRRSPLIQGGLEVPCQVTVSMTGSIVNHLLLSRYGTLLRELYIEPKDEEIMGTFLSVMNEPAIEVEPPQPRKERSKPKNTVKSKDIRQMFASTSATEKRTDNNEGTIVIN